MGPNFDAMTLVQIRQFLRKSSVCIPARASRAQLLQIAKAHGFISDEGPKDEDVQMTGTSPEPELSKLSTEEHETKTESSSGEVALDDPLTNIPTQSDDVSYLQPGFNPASITIAKLRNILSAHEVPYATAKTKNDFVLLFLTDIKPRAAATLMAMASVKRTDAGIIDMRH